MVKGTSYDDMKWYILLSITTLEVLINVSSSSFIVLSLGRSYKKDNTIITWKTDSRYLIEWITSKR